MKQLLHFKDYGAGLPLIILHGLFGTGDNWNTIAKHLADQFRIIVPDLRNHGRSFHSKEHSLQLMTEDILHLMDFLNIEKANILGHSMGGKVAMTLSLMYPYRCSGLIVADIAARGYSRGHDSVFAALDASDPENAIDRKEIQQRLHPFLQDEITEQFLMKSLVRNPEGGKGFHWRFNPEALYENYENIIGPVWSEKPYIGPVLFIRGSRSNYILDSDLSQIRQLFPTAVLQEIQNAGHWVHADQPQEIIRIIHQFLLAQNA
jgi:pimeloyl-ACP methyl ester carboxylesterase